MPGLPGYSETDSNRRFAHEQEGYGKCLSHNENESPRCCSKEVSVAAWNTDFRGSVPGTGVIQKDSEHIEWETSPAEWQDDCTFCFIMQTHVIPEFRPVYPYITATLAINDDVKIPVPLAKPTSYQTTRDGVCLYFEPRRFVSMAESQHRLWNPDGVSGIYRVTVPASMITKGKPVRLKLTLDESKMDIVAYAALSPRKDVLSLSLATLRNEVAQLQSDMVGLKMAFASLSARTYTELFPNYLKAERGVAIVEETWHMHPPTLCKYDGDNILLTYRRATDHLAADGACYAVRSFDKGKTFTGPELMFDLGRSDHRSTAVLQISNGDLVGGDYRVGAGYDDEGKFSSYNTVHAHSLWGVWSEDRGKTWHFTEPLTAPSIGGRLPYIEAERPPIELPGGRLLLSGQYCTEYIDEDRLFQFALGVWYSDDKGRTWGLLGVTPPYTEVDFPHQEVEPTIIRCDSGKIVMLIRTGTYPVTDWEKKGMLMQSDSYDDGKTWSKLYPTEMPSMDTPAHLILLADGRLLATHAQRSHPGAIYVTTSSDEGVTWDTGRTKIVTQDLNNFDATYPTSVQFSDGSLLTVWYANRFGKFHIGTARYAVSDLD